MKQMALKIQILGFALFFALTAEAKVSALFHPYDNTLQAIATWLGQAQTRIDIAMYNMETSSKSPVIAFLQSQGTQDRIASGDLKVRVLFEGYGTDEENAVRMKEIEATGADVRFLGSGKKVHHKFAVIDGDTNDPYVITGSANWSLSSLKNYNENILFIQDEPTLAQAYQKEFELLWKYSKEFQNDLEIDPVDVAGIESTEDDIAAHFNSDNYTFSAKGVRLKPKAEGFTLTRQVVCAIDEAQSEIEIATTRFKLRPVYEALQRAADRGVKIRMVLSMDDFEPVWIREKSSLKNCSDVFEASCSSGTSFGGFLAGLENADVEVRIKYYNLDHREYILKQMHSKYILIDGEHLLSGSFNWSVSSEQNHIENMVELAGPRHQEVLSQYRNDFQRLWEMGRGNYSSVYSQVKSTPHGSGLKCALEPMTLTYEQIDNLIAAFKGKKCL